MTNDEPPFGRTSNRPSGEQVTNTAYPKVNAALAEYLAALAREFGREMLSVYLLGSLSTNNYIPNWSDVNGVIILRQGDPAQIRARIESVRQAVLAAHPQWRNLVFSCGIPAAALRNTTWQNQPDGWGLINLTNLIEDGVLVWGEEVCYDLERPNLEALRAYAIWELVQVLESAGPLPLRAPQDDEWSGYRQHPLQVVNWLVYPTRVLLTWDKGRVGSKSEAVNHYIEEYHGPWEPALLQADTLRRTANLEMLTPQVLQVFAGQAPGLFEWMVKHLLDILFLPPEMADAARNLRRWLDHDPSLPPARPGQTYDIFIPDRKPWLRTSNSPEGQEDPQD